MSYTKNVYHIVFGTYLPSWNGWAEGYAEFTCSFYSMQPVLDYVKNQKVHHSKMTFGEELRNMLDKIGIAYDERYLPK